MYISNNIFYKHLGVLTVMASFFVIAQQG